MWSLCSSCCTCGRPLHRLTLHASAVTLSIGVVLDLSDCSLATCQWFQTCASLRRGLIWWFVRSPRATLSQLIMVSHVRLFSCINLLLFASPFHISAQTSKLFFHAFRKSYIASWYYSPSWLRCLDRPLVLISHCKPLQRNITCTVVSFNVFVSSFANSYRFTARLSLSIVFFANFALRRHFGDYELSDVNVSLITVQVRCGCVHHRTFSFFTEIVLFQALVCGARLKMILTQSLMRSRLFCCSSWSSTRSHHARKYAWIAGACGATSDGLSCQIVRSRPTPLAIHSAGMSPE